MLNSEGHMPWQGENQLMKSCFPKETDKEIIVGQNLIIKNHQVPHKTLQQCQVMLPERSQGLSRLLTVHWKRNSKQTRFCFRQVRWQRFTLLQHQMILNIQTMCAQQPSSTPKK